MKKPPNNSQILEVVEFTNKDFDLQINGLELSSYQTLTNILTTAVQRLMDSDFERFLNALYRIDVDEQKVKMAFAQEDNVARAIAEQIIQRELLKVKTREQYK